MSEMREKVKFAPNVERNLTLMFDNGKEVTSQYGTSYLWGVKENGEEKSMFATETLNSLITALQPKSGDTVTIKKVMEEGAKTPHFTVNGKTMNNIHDGMAVKDIQSTFKEKVNNVINGEFAGKPPQYEITEKLNEVAKKMISIEMKLDDFISYVKSAEKVKDLI